MDVITHIPVRVDNDTFVLSVDGGRALAVARRHSEDEYELLWFAGDWPEGVVLDVLETAGFSVEQPHGRVFNG